MKFQRSKQWWLDRIDLEGDYWIGAGVPDPPPLRPAGRLLLLFLSVRAHLAWLWRIGLIKRTTAFRWEMDRFLGEYTRQSQEPSE